MGSHRLFSMCVLDVIIYMQGRFYVMFTTLFSVDLSFSVDDREGSGLVKKSGFFFCCIMDVKSS